MSTPRASGKAIALALLAIYLIWGSTYLAILFAIETIPPFLMTGARWLAAGVALYAWMRLRGAPRPTLVQWRSAVIVGALLAVGGNSLVAWAETRIPSGLTALLVAMVPLNMVLLQWASGGERPGFRVASGIVLGMLGVAVLVDPVRAAGGSGLDLVGVGVVLLATLLWAIGSLYSRKAPLPKEPLIGAGMEMIAGGVILFGVATAAGEWPHLDVPGISLKSWLGLAFLSIFGSIVGYSAYVWLLQVAPPARVSTYAFVNPVVAVLLGWLFAGEVLSWRIAAAGGLIVAAVALIVLAGAKRTEPPTTPRAPPTGAPERAVAPET